MHAELAFDADAPEQFPKDALPEVAFVGRSNVGKSSLINTLVGRRKLARTSSTPGKTRRLHFYRIEHGAYFVDLPGYGYAGVSKRERETWRPMVESYLRGTREALRGCILLIDARRGPENEELDLLDWLESEGIDARVVLTKADKLGKQQVAKQARAFAEQLKLSSAQCAAASTKTGRGLATPVEWIHEWTGLELKRPDGSKFA